MPSLLEYIGWAAQPEKHARLKAQWDEACDKGTVTCGCGQLRALTHAFRCLYCGEWFCVPCAEKHFEESIQERLARTRAEKEKFFSNMRGPSLRVIGLARNLYAQYCEAIGTASNDEPSWEQLINDRDKLRQYNAWIAVAHKAREELEASSLCSD